MTDQHVAHDDLVALALQQVEPDERARLSEHLARCASCHEAYAELEDAVQNTLAAAPSIAPPAGFSGRVLEALEEAEPNPASTGPSNRWRWLAVAAAALVIGLALGIGGTLVVTDQARPTASTPGDATSAAALVTPAGDTVGTAGTAVLSGRDYLLIAVTRARPGAAYECIVVGTDGQRQPAGSWTLQAEPGATEASGSWMVEAPPGEIARVELVTPSGRVWAQAEL